VCQWKRVKRVDKCVSGRELTGVSVEESEESLSTPASPHQSVAKPWALEERNGAAQGMNLHNSVTASINGGGATYTTRDEQMR